MLARKLAPLGRNGSKSSETYLIKHKLPSPELRKLLERVFDFWQGDEREPKDVYERRRFDFVFHMTDWLRDLEGLTKLYAHPTDVNTKEARRLVFEFLTH